MNDKVLQEEPIKLERQPLQVINPGLTAAACVDAIIKKVLCHKMSRGQIKMLVPDMLAAVKEMLV